MARRLPKPGEHWRVRIRPVEFDCPYCKVPIEVGMRANDGMLVRIVEDPKVPFVHVRRGCNLSFPLPEGWICYSTAEVDRDQTIYALPYTLFEPQECSAKSSPQAW